MILLYHNYSINFFNSNVKICINFDTIMPKSILNNRITNMRKNNTAFLKMCIGDAILDLLQSKPIDKISIDEITNKAGVGRATYFRNFSSKTEAITYKINTLWDDWCDNNGIMKEQRYTVNTALDFFNFSYSYKELYKLLYKENLQGTIYDAFYNVIVKQHRSTPKEYYKSRFLSYGVYGIVDEWVKRDFEQSPMELSIILKETLKSSCQEI